MNSQKVILYGTIASPFVRRIRVLLDGIYGKNYEFKLVDFFDPDQRKKFKEISPVLKIPILQHGNETLFDSRVIFNFLNKSSGNPPPTLQEENLLTIIDGLTDSLVHKLTAQRSQVEFPPGSNLEISHRERVVNSLNFLDSQIALGTFSNWNYPSICLFGAIDWILFRDLQNLAPFKNLLAFHAQNKDRPEMIATDPRRS